MGKILIITFDNCDDAELLYPLYRMREAGYTVDIASLERRTVRAKYHFTAEATLLPHEICPEEYDGLILPGGTAPEKLRLNRDVLVAVRAIAAAGKPVAAICHGPQILLSAGLISGCRCTCYPGIRDDVIAAGAIYSDESVVVDAERRVVTSRRPDDLPDFMREYIRLLVG